jgi:catechol 2,3-dioxygenase-like lactoylglutathione lyase family enzyme
MATVRYLVKDVPSALAFYVDHLGFEEGERWGEVFATVTRGDLTLWLSGPQTSAARPMEDGSRPQAGGWNRLVIQVEDIERFVDEMAAAGVVVRRSVISGPGGKQALVEDPSGNPVELFQLA